MGQNVYVVEIISEDEWKHIDREEELLSDEEREQWRIMCESPHTSAKIRTPWHDFAEKTYEYVKRPLDLSLIHESIRVALDGFPNRFCYLA